jgi:3-methyladenine DNA glycosylase AlkD
MGGISDIHAALRVRAKLERARVSQSFFKTGPGQYGEGDRFLGVSVPDTRDLIKPYADISLKTIDRLLHSVWHEERLLALLVLVHRFQRAKEEKVRKGIVEYYLSHTDRINNWDLVDTSAPHILGVWLLDHPKTVLTRLARSQSLWERRIAIVSTFTFIRTGKSEETFRIAEMLLADKQDLIHKAVGWMLREVGKCCGEEALDGFLEEYHDRLPRTTLRYAIERYAPDKKRRYLAKISH